MLREIREPNPGASEGDIAAFEKEFRFVLPESYRRFLMETNGGRPQPAGFPIQGLADNPVGVVQAFFGLNAKIKAEDLRSIVEELQGLIPHGIVPIACTDGDDFVCMDLRDTPNVVVFWDRRSFWGANNWNENDLYPIARDFESFLETLSEPHF